ncbi:MAG TPA: hypothetical protein VEI97_13025, partial [bacterium]|nr:hypothetical protein [bacterium]
LEGPAMLRLPVILLLLFCALAMATGCVKADPKDLEIEQKAIAQLKANWNPAADTMIKKSEIFNYTWKIWVVDDFKAEDIKKFTEEAAKAFGQNARTNGKVNPTYDVQVFQRMKNESTNKEGDVNVAKGVFHNGKEKTEVELYGQGSSKFDYK